MTKKVGYFSAYYRGLECLLGMWKDIKKEVPDAELHIYYGWESWVGLEGKDSFYLRMTRKLDELKDYGVIEHGRVSHTELADRMKECQVWAYPTEFPEINCITALKANAAGCKPVITSVAALTETGGPEATYFDTKVIYTDDYTKKKFKDEIIKQLNNPDNDKSKQTEFAKKHDWSEIAKQWEVVING